MNKILALVLLAICLNAANSFAFNETITHPDLSKRAFSEKSSGLGAYLINQLGFQSGINTLFLQKNLLEWLQYGSTAEDIPNCRAANHFHNPLLPWDQSQSTDFWPMDLVCQLQGWTPRYSNITWATGLKSPGDTPGHRNLQDMGWDNARQYFHNALTATDAPIRERHFVKAFQALGQTLHLLQDMAVPAHVRNDFLSHLTFAGINPGGITNWFLNPFETYVKKNPTLVTSLSQIPTYPIIGATVSDFWDTDSRAGAPFLQGLAEYTNAGYFSDYTIPGNAHIPFFSSHIFPSPQIPNYTCYDKIPGTNDKRKYASRQPCPINGGPVDHFAAISMFTPRLLGLPPIPLPFFNKYALDDNVHKTYAGELLPKTVGYSAALLDYFFRGKIEVKPVSTSTNTITVSAKNITTNGDAMTGGTLDLVLRYRTVSDPDMLFRIVPLTDYQYLDIKLSGNQTIDTTTKEFTFDLSATPLPDWASEVTAWLVYRGQLGNEADAVAVGQTVLRDTPRKMTLSLPAVGVYGKTDGSTGFTQITVAATSNIPGLDLSDGLIELVMIHRTSDSDPFQGARVTTSPADPLKYRYIRASEQTGKRTMMQGVKTELTFDISDNPLPVWASDVYMYISYKKAGDPDSMTRAVGFLDISEPTTIDVFNNADKICMNNQWYDAGSSAAIALVDTNNNGMAEEVDVYPNNIANIFYKASSIVTSTLASDTDYTLNSPEKLLGGSSRRLGYILTDYNFNSSFTQDWVDGPNFWGEWTTTESNTGTAVKHQTDPDGSFTYPGMQTIRGNKIWWGAGLIYDNQNYPFDSPDCSWDAL